MQVRVDPFKILSSNCARRNRQGAEQILDGLTTGNGLDFRPPHVQVTVQTSRPLVDIDIKRDRVPLSLADKSIRRERQSGCVLGQETDIEGISPQLWLTAYRAF